MNQHVSFISQLIDRSHSKHKLKISTSFKASYAVMLRSMNKNQLLNTE
jgi:hypothetical protein